MVREEAAEQEEIGRRICAAIGLPYEMVITSDNPLDNSLREYVEYWHQRRRGFKSRLLRKMNKYLKFVRGWHKRLEILTTQEHSHLWMFDTTYYIVRENRRVLRNG